MMKTQKRVFAMIAMIAIAGLAGVQGVSADVKTGGVTLQTDVQEVITLNCGAGTVNLGNLTPGTPVTGSSTCTAVTNANGGYNLAVKRDDATSTMHKTTEPAVTIADKTAWDAATPNAAVYGTTGLGFTVFASTATKNDAWWGAGATVTDAANLYAGFPVGQTDIMRHAAYAPLGTSTDIGYKLDVPATQKSGAYTGNITYQVTTTP